MKVGGAMASAISVDARVPASLPFSAVPRLMASLEEYEAKLKMCRPRKALVIQLQMKLEAIKKLNKGVSVREISEEFGKSEVTIYQWKQRQDKILDFIAKIVSPEGLVGRAIADPPLRKTLDNELFFWYEEALQRNQYVSWRVLRNEAKRINYELTGVDNFSPSRPWIYRWKNRHGITGLFYKSPKGSRKRPKRAPTTIDTIEILDDNSVDEPMEHDEDMVDEAACTIDFNNGPKVFAEPPANLLEMERIPKPETDDLENNANINSEPLQESADAVQEPSSSETSLLKQLLTKDKNPDTKMKTDTPPVEHTITDKATSNESITVKEELIEDVTIEDATSIQDVVIKQEVIENKSTSVGTQTECDDDEAFMITVLPIIRRLSPTEKSILRAQILQLIQCKESQ